MAEARRPTRVWLWPAVLALLTGVGLLAALLGGAPWAWASWLGLAAPLAAPVLRIAAGWRRSVSS